MGVSGVGNQLRIAREQQHLTIRDVANATNIRSDHILAMEAEEWQVFGARVYVKGFVRTYAQHLKMNVPEVLGQLDQQLNRGDEGDPDGLDGEDSVDGRIRRGVLDAIMLGVSRVRWSIAFPVLLGLGVLFATVLGVIRWNQDRKKDPVEDLPPGLYQGTTPTQPAARSTGRPTVLPLPTNATTSPRR